MEIDIDRVKKSLRLLLCRITDRIRYERCKAATDMLHVLKLAVFNVENRNHVVKRYLDLANGLINGISEFAFDAAIDRLEQDFIGAIIAPLGILPSVYQNYYQMALASTYSLGNLLSYIIYYELMNNLSQIQFNTFWQLYFKGRALKCSNMNDTLYIQQVARKIICGGITGNNEVILLDKIYQFCYYLFGNGKTFKFLYNANLIYEKFTGLNDDSIRYKKKGLTVSCTKLNTTAQYLEGTIQLGSQFSIEPTGLVNDNRCDNFVTFGKSIFADVKFPPDDKKINSLTFAIFFNGEFYFIIDCCRKPTTNVANLLTPHILYDIKQEMIFNIGGDAHVYVKKIEQMNDEDDTFQGYDVYPSELCFEYLDGRIAKGGNKTQFLRTYNKETRQLKTEFLFGKGGSAAKVSDVYCDLGNTSRSHLMIYYKGIDRWKISDYGSTNGTYLLLKNGNEFAERKYSDCLNLFFSDKYDPNDNEEDRKYKESVENTATICIAGYTLFILQQSL